MAQGTKANDHQTLNSLDPQSLVQFLEIAYNLRRAISAGKQLDTEQLQASTPMLVQLLEYMINNISNPNLDHTLIPFLEKILGFKLRKKKDKDEELEKEQDEKIDKEERERRNRLAIYELYKVINPRRLAGETDLENFISNVQTRGIQVALQNDGKEYAIDFKAQELENLESYRHGFTQTLKDGGTKGFGPGL